MRRDLNIITAEERRSTINQIRRDIVPPQLVEKEARLSGQLATVQSQIETKRASVARWDALLGRYDWLRARLEAITAKVEDLRIAVEEAPRKVSEYLGLPSYDVLAVRAVDVEVATAQQLPIYQRTENQVRAELEQHIADIKSFAAEHGVPEDLVPTMASPSFNGRFVPDARITDELRECMRPFVPDKTLN